MRELQLWATEESLDEVFDDVAALATQCRFSDCTHSNEPQCAIQSALERGEIDSARWRSYCKLKAELRHELLQKDALAATAVKAKWKAIHKAMRKHPKYRR
jgi:ribosome biogenesis GTPase